LAIPAQAVGSSGNESGSTCNTNNSKEKLLQMKQQGATSSSSIEGSGKGKNVVSSTKLTVAADEDANGPSDKILSSSISDASMSSNTDRKVEEEESKEET